LSREGVAIVVRIPGRFYRRNGRQMVPTRGDNGQVAFERETNGSLVSATAKAYRWQEQLESDEYTGLKDLAAPLAATAPTSAAFCGLLLSPRRS
jgi:hypothetical protein